MLNTRMLKTIIVKAVSNDKNKEESYWDYLQVNQNPSDFSEGIWLDRTKHDHINKKIQIMIKNTTESAESLYELYEKFQSSISVFIKFENDIRSLISKRESNYKITQEDQQKTEEFRKQITEIYNNLDNKEFLTILTSFVDKKEFNVFFEKSSKQMRQMKNQYIMDQNEKGKKFTHNGIQYTFSNGSY